jgi:hypothetical protein
VKIYGTYLLHDVLSTNVCARFETLRGHDVTPYTAVTLLPILDSS